MHRYTSKVPSKDTNSRFQANKTLAVRSHFKIGSHFSGNPVNSSVCAKRWAHIISWSMVIPEKASFVTGTSLSTTDPLPVDSRQ